MAAALDAAVLEDLAGLSVTPTSCMTEPFLMSKE
jgi:hypothetical protein